MPAPDLTLVVPVFATAHAIDALARRVAAALDGVASWEIVFVDDASPDRAREALAALCRAEPRAAALGLARNAGQHRALLAGFARARGRRVAALDGDLQDAPEAIPRLLAAAERAELVFAGRRGEYQSAARRLFSRLFKRLLAAATGLPADAGLFFVADGALARRVAERSDPDPFVTVALACERPRTLSIPVERAPRAEGRSAYGAFDRWALAARALRYLARRRLLGERGARRRAPAPAVAYRLGWLAEAEEVP
jgi:glycosyltransferase involved in cell wall biosynthesis